MEETLKEFDEITKFMCEHDLSNELSPTESLILAIAHKELERALKRYNARLSTIINEHLQDL